MMIDILLMGFNVHNRAILVDVRIGECVVGAVIHAFGK